VTLLRRLAGAGMRDQGGAVRDAAIRVPADRFFVADRSGNDAASA